MKKTNEKINGLYDSSRLNNLQLIKGGKNNYTQQGSGDTVYDSTSYDVTQNTYDKNGTLLMSDEFQTGGNTTTDAPVPG